MVLCPADQLVDLGELAAGEMKLVPVGTLDGAIWALQVLQAS